MSLLQETTTSSSISSESKESYAIGGMDYDNIERNGGGIERMMIARNNEKNTNTCVMRQNI